MGTADNVNCVPNPSGSVMCFFFVLSFITSSPFLKHACLCAYMCICVCLPVLTHTCHGAFVRGRGQLSGIGSFPPQGSQDSICKAWRYEPFTLNLLTAPYPLCFHASHCIVLTQIIVFAETFFLSVF